MAWGLPSLSLPSWSTVTDFAGDILGGVGDIATEALDVPGALWSGRWGDIPGEIGETFAEAGEVFGIGGAGGAPEEYVAALTQGGNGVAQGSSTAQRTMNGSAGVITPVNGGSMTTNGAVLEVDPKTGRLRKRMRRRRRRRLLTASDKADIAYLVGVLGTGQLGKAAVTAVLSRRV